MDHAIVASRIFIGIWRWARITFVHPDTTNEIGFSVTSITLVIVMCFYQLQPLKKANVLKRYRVDNQKKLDVKKLLSDFAFVT